MLSNQKCIHCVKIELIGTAQKVTYDKFDTSDFTGQSHFTPLKHFSQFSLKALNILCITIFINTGLIGQWFPFVEASCCISILSLFLVVSSLGWIFTGCVICIVSGYLNRLPIFHYGMNQITSENTNVSHASRVPLWIINHTVLCISELLTCAAQGQMFGS